MTTDERETWKNSTGARIYVLVNDPFTPGKMDQRLISPGAEFSITPLERKRNEEVSPIVNPFKNGFLSPVELVETAADFEALQSEPNVRSDSELAELLGQHANKLKAELASIDSYRLVERMIEMADAGSVDVSVAKMKALQERLDEIKPVVNRELGDQTGDIKAQHLGNIRLN